MDAPLHAALPAADLARARAWYRDHLDLKPVQEADGGQGLVYESGGTRFLVYLSSFAGTNQATAAAIPVEDFDAAISELRSRGVTLEDYDFGDDFKTVDGVMTAPDGSRGAWFKDSEGNIIGVSDQAL
jgi:catechol 2,3-dioxygenase-like lactoylglutathione lyase family enzyme